METVIWIVGLAIPIACLLFLFGYLKGLVDGSEISNWGTGFDDGWNAYKELVIERGGLTMDLISKTALLNDLCEDREEGTFCFTDSQAEAADKIIVYVTKRINAQTPIPAVPLDKLCEWLEKNACYYKTEDNGGSTRFSLDSCQWKIVLAKWMEELDE